MAVMATVLVHTLSVGMFLSILLLPFTPLGILLIMVVAASDFLGMKHSMLAVIVGSLLATPIMLSALYEVFAMSAALWLVAFSVLPSSFTPEGMGVAAVVLGASDVALMMMGIFLASLFFGYWLRGRVRGRISEALRGTS